MTNLFSDKVKEDLYHCLKCGMCQQVCPTFRATRLEYFAPRGRVQIVKHYLEGDLRMTDTFAETLMSCILCDACAAMCPSGVRIDRVLRGMRGEMARVRGPGLLKKVLFSALRHGPLTRTGAGIARMARGLLVDTLNVGWKIGNMPMGRLPRLNRGSFRAAAGERIVPRSPGRGKLLYFTGCGTNHMYGDVGRSVVHVLSMLGFEICIPRDQVCCAAPMFLTGFSREALPNIHKNLSILDRTDADAIVMDCATCAAAFRKEIPALLEDLGQDAQQALRVAAKVKDVSQVVCEFLDALEMDDKGKGRPVRVTYHDPCHLARGMGVVGEPRRILGSIPGVSLTEMEGSGECCGGGGSYQFEYVALSGAIGSRKRDNIRTTGAGIVATGCPGCRLTLSGILHEDPEIEVMHTMQVLADKLRTSESER